MSKDFDFYSYGQRMAAELEESYKKTAEEIEEKYGSDARLEFEVGLSVALGKQSSTSLNDFVPKMRESLGYYEGDVAIDEKLRNNSYLGGAGVSNKYDSDGKYNQR